MGQSFPNQVDARSSVQRAVSRYHHAESRDSLPTYQHILVALDGSEVSERVLPHVEALAPKLGARVTVLRATTSPATIIAQTAPEMVPVAPEIIDPMPIVEAEQEQASDYLEGVTERLRAHGLIVEHEQIAESAVEAILERAAELEVDLIAMATHAHGGLKRMIFGSVADEVLHKAHCPVLLVRAGHDE